MYAYIIQTHFWLYYADINEMEGICRVWGPWESGAPACTGSNPALTTWLSASLSSATLVSPASRRHRRSLRFTTRRQKGAGRAGGELAADWSEAGPAHRGIKPESARLRAAARALRDTRTHPGITFSREERTKRHERVRSCDKDTKRRRDAETQEEETCVCACAWVTFIQSIICNKAPRACTLRLCAHHCRTCVMEVSRGWGGGWGCYWNPPPPPPPPEFNLESQIKLYL